MFLQIALGHEGTASVKFYGLCIVNLGHTNELGLFHWPHIRNQAASIN